MPKGYAKTGSNKGWFKEGEEHILFKHGMCDTPTYKIWNGMIKRCYSKSNTAYQKYGAKGIKVCKRWHDSFENFYNDMGERPEGMTLDRIDGTKGYSPSNCRWADRVLQNINQRLRKDNKTGVKGVTIRKRKKGNVYVAAIGVNGKRIVLGQFDNIEDAAKVRKQAEQKYWKKYV